MEWLILDNRLLLVEISENNYWPPKNCFNGCWTVWSRSLDRRQESYQGNTLRCNRGNTRSSGIKNGVIEMQWIEQMEKFPRSWRGGGKMFGRKMYMPCCRGMWFVSVAGVMFLRLCSDVPYGSRCKRTGDRAWHHKPSRYPNEILGLLVKHARTYDG